MRSRILLSGLLLCVLFFTGCHKAQKKYDRALLPGESALRKITNPEEIPDFTFACYELKDLKAAVGNSLSYLSKPSSKTFFPMGDITHERAKASLEAFEDLLNTNLFGAQLNQAILDKFDVYMSVGCDYEGTVLFTGYYTPIFDGSPTQTGRFRYPLYKQPADLEKAEDGKILGRRTGAGGALAPYPPRAVIEETGMLKGNEIMWLTDPFEVYIAHVQGSAKIRLPDGTLTTVGYAANNGHEYESISMRMVADGAITKSQLSLSAMIDYFQRHPEQVAKYTRLNPRYVFFRAEKGSPRGSLNEPVIPYRSIATDKSIFPRASLVFIDTYLPRDINGSVKDLVFRGFVLDQDTGGAIRAPGRCDVYMGEGDIAGLLAGRTYREGKMYYLFLKSDESLPGF
jgi:membrane-bound lytic murein transglycosylase A